MKYHHKIWSFALMGIMLWFSIAYLLSSKHLPHTTQKAPHLIIQTGEKLYDWVMFDIFEENVRSEAIANGEMDQKELFDTLKENDFYNCSSKINEGGWTVHYCDNITGTYYKFDVPEWWLRIWYFEQSNAYSYTWTWKVLFYEPKIEDWYLSWNTLYWDNVFAITYFSTWGKNEVHYPDCVEYKWTKFFNTERDNKSGKQYENLPKEWKYKRYARVSFIRHKNKDNYYMLFQEFRECGPFCWIDQHAFNFFLK